ncbi:LysM peptidoglycan-binding domain-containing protein [Amphibacillus sediminis]|uniref:LysM peptidoglycan-binding domain-containing protein n=1 Tax=Amphibacillus sediminis TaxID=360185 RepID=UPI00082A87A9|nr:LysM peptidoglycan-binding domain-containing protein [Amphibacillus sediminis]
MSYGIWLSFNDQAEGFQLPINPEMLEVADSVDGQSYQISKLGEINVIKDRALTDYSFTSIFPIQRLPMVVSDQLLPPKRYLSLIEKWMSSGKPVRFIFTGDGFDINTYVSIESFDWQELAGTGGEIEYSISLKKYLFYAAKPVKVKMQVGQPPRARAQSAKRADTKGTPKVYKLVKGDSLWKVAQKFLGSGSRYPEIAKLNQIKSSDYRRLPIGLAIKIPPK